MGWGVRGLIEGFYGRPWSWDERVEVARWCAERGMTDYVYAPKDDPLHRDRWRDPYPEAELDGFRRLAAEGGLRVGFALSPGLSIDYAAEADTAALWAKVESVLGAGVASVVLALDDLPSRPGLGEDHAALTRALHDRLDGRAALTLVPTEYLGSRPTPYLDALAAEVPDDVAIAWTGESVVNDSVTAGQARARAAVVGGRAPLLWDNWPVNDAVMADRLHLGPLTGRDPALAEACCGYLANPMVQPRASTLPLASTAAWLTGLDPRAAWEAEADRLGWRTLAEACDGAVPNRLVDAFAQAGGGPGWDEAAAPLAAWLEAAADCSAPGLEDEAGPWLEQVRAEAGLGRRALRLYAATRAAPVDPEAVLRGAFSLLFHWPALRRSPVSVLGVRCGARPALRQRPDGVWAVTADAWQEDHNALDALVRLALDAAATLDDDTG